MMYLPRLEQGQRENIFAWANSFQAAFQFAKWSVDLHLSPSLRHILLQHGSTMLESSGDFSHAREFGVEGRSSCTAAASLLTCDLHFKVQKGSCESLYCNILACAVAKMNGTADLPLRLDATTSILVCHQAALAEPACRKRVSGISGVVT